MTKEDKQQLGQEAESVLDFKDAKEMTIGQANRKAEEIEAGVKETDNVQRLQPLWNKRRQFQTKNLQQK